MISKLYTIPHTVMMQSVDDETLLFDSATELFFALNDTGAILWESISENSDLAAVYDELMEAFEVAPDQLSADLETFTSSLAALGLVVFSV